MQRTPEKEENTAYINTKISGEPAKILQKLEERHLVQDNTDAICQALISLWERVIQRDMMQRELDLRERELL